MGRCAVTDLRKLAEQIVNYVREGGDRTDGTDEVIEVERVLREALEVREDIRDIRDLVCEIREYTFTRGYTGRWDFDLSVDEAAKLIELYLARGNGCDRDDAEERILREAWEGSDD